MLIFLVQGKIINSDKAKQDKLHTYLKKDFIYFFREGEKHQCVVDSHVPPTGDLARNPGMCPDWELNRRPFGLQAGA